MAKIRVYRDERNGENFPPMCVRCGGTVQHDIPIRFAWMPSWAHLFIFLGLLPWLIACLILRKSMRVVLPVCNDHRRHWRNRRLYVLLGFLFWLTYGIALAVVWDDLPKDFQMIPLDIFAVGGLFWLLTAALYSNSGIKPVRITERFIELVGANKEFAREWEEDDPKPTMRERAARGGYDED